MTRPSLPDIRAHQHDSRAAFRWIALLTMALVGIVALLPIAPAAADNIAATATVCVPGPDNFCPPTPTPSVVLPLHLYLPAVQLSDLPLQ